MDYLAYFITAASILGTVANSLQKRWCFWVWLCTNSFWCVYNTINGQYAQTLLYVFNLLTCIVGLLKWRQISDTLKAAKETITETDSGHKKAMSQKQEEAPPKHKNAWQKFNEWYALKTIQTIKNRAIKHKKHRTRKKNLARFGREYKKYIRRNGRV